jgi:hypothetical protein
MSMQNMTHRARGVARIFVLGVVGALGFHNAHAADASQDFWHNTQARSLPDSAPQIAVYRPLLLDVAGMQAHLAVARHNRTAVALSLPHPDGSFSDFLLVDSRTLPDALQDKYPEIVSLQGIDEAGRQARVDISSLGFQAMVFDRDGVWVVRPEAIGLGQRYMSFRRVDLPVPGHGFQCGVHSDEKIDASGRNLVSSNIIQTTSGLKQRTFRAAVAANHQYVAAVGGGTLAGGLAAIATAMNRVNQIYETELGVHMTLIANNNLLVYPNAVGDPYSNGTGALNENQTNVDSVIGSANYDIGHVFTTGSGGVAGLGVTCSAGSKAGGTTGLPNPTGDAFYVDYVAHEMGHQFGGNHTFNSTTSNCGGGNRANSAAYESGSGTTIMAYAGICGADNTQPHSDPYFHAKSLEEINTRLTGSGGACSASVNGTDAIPTIDTLPMPGLTIPIHTPFALTAAASDIDGDALTYNWEQYDRATATTLAQGDIGTGPIFRSFNATSSGTRVFPKLDTVLGAPLVPGETWPTKTRTAMTFRLTVRDNHGVPAAPQFGANISTTTATDYKIGVTATAGPFLVTRPNTALTWGRGESHKVTWNVANTDIAPVSCSSVAIDLSTDGGFTWPSVLSAGTANNGTAMIVVPTVADTSQARVRVKCVGNVFFDVSDLNFAIAATGDPDPTGPIASATPGSFTFSIDGGTTASDTLTLANAGIGAGSSETYAITESIDACVSTAAVDWLSATPPSGSIVGGASTPVTVGVQGGESLGVRTASLCVTTNDPAHTKFVIPVTMTVNQQAGDEIFADDFEPAVAPPQPVQDPSFEATIDEGGPNPFWASLDTNEGAGGGTNFLSASGSQIPVRTGDWAIWFGGWQGGDETQDASQSVTIPSGSPRFLNYWRLIGDLPDAPGTLTVTIDGTTIESLDVSAADADEDFVARSIDIGSYADGNVHLVKFQYVYTDGGDGIDGDIFIDDVTVDATAARGTMHRDAPVTRHQRKHRH